MPIAFPIPGTLGQTYAYGGKTYFKLRNYWSALGVGAVEPNTFTTAVKQNYYETLVTTAPNPVNNMPGVLLTYYETLVTTAPNPVNNMPGVLLTYL